MTAGVVARTGGGLPDSGFGPGRRLVEALPAIGVFVVVLGAWELVLAALGIQQFLIPRPSVIAAALVDQWPILQRGLVYTGSEALGGLAVG
jgi:NitT/TauT family transport system permease protein